MVLGLGFWVGRFTVRVEVLEELVCLRFLKVIPSNSSTVEI